MTLIFCASTQLGAPSNTGHFFRPILHWLFPAISDETFDKIHHLIRKSAHFTEYALLGVLSWRAIRSDPAFRSLSPIRRFRLALLFCVFYAATDEFHQSFIPTREAAVSDVLLDSSGSAVALLAVGAVCRIRGAS